MREFRSIDNAEFKIIEGSRRIEGYAILFNQESIDLGGFTEIIDKNALDGIIERSDVIAFFDHNQDKVLARSTNGKGTLELKLDQKGLKYGFDAPQTPNGEEVLDAIRRGDLRNSSFGFITRNENIKGEWRGTKFIRTVKKIDILFDVSPVFRPAYSDTTAITRSIQAELSQPVENLTQEPVLGVQEPSLINIRYNDNDYTIPLLEPIKSVIDKTDNERKMNEYFQEMENEVQSLKK
ncbi:MAG: HK97 family phage prohead protease [Bacteroidetes bacterium]|nr:HK97 family phage prohead protease [Bacteroidota bacterium]